MASQFAEMNAAGYETEAMPVQVPQSARSMRVSRYNDAGFQMKSNSPEWDLLLTNLAGENAIFEERIRQSSGSPASKEVQSLFLF